MQNRYTGDIGDFSKLGLLRRLRATGLTIGLNWYLVPDENHNDDGRHISYLKKEAFRALDPQLFDELKGIVEHEERVISAMEKPEILDVVYYSEPLIFKDRDDRTLIRMEWHEGALSSLGGLDIICLDPDNGLIVPSAVGTRKENKYAYPGEIFDYYEQGSSVICYQHKARKKDDFYQKRFADLINSIPGADGLLLKFKTTSQRYYMFVLQPAHAAIVRKAVEEMLETEWNEHFERIPL